MASIFARQCGDERLDRRTLTAADPVPDDLRDAHAKIARRRVH
jgi:hypothetical protein